MLNQLQIQSKARADIIELAVYIGRDSVRVARKVVITLRRDDSHSVRFPRRTLLYWSLALPQYRKQVSVPVINSSGSPTQLNLTGFAGTKRYPTDPASVEE